VEGLNPSLTNLTFRKALCKSFSSNSLLILHSHLFVVVLFFFVHNLSDCLVFSSYAALLAQVGLLNHAWFLAINAVLHSSSNHSFFSGLSAYPSIVVATSRTPCLRFSQSLSVSSSDSCWVSFSPSSFWYASRISGFPSFWMFILGCLDMWPEGCNIYLNIILPFVLHVSNLPSQSLQMTIYLSLLQLYFWKGMSEVYNVLHIWNFEQRGHGILWLCCWKFWLKWAVARLL
jgi:hypothetical protein